MKKNNFFEFKKNQPENKDNKFKFNYNLNSLHLMRLVARNYFKNYGAIFNDFLLPTIVISILFSVLDEIGLRTMLPGVLISPLISSGFISFSMAVFQWKRSVIFKKIKISQISTIQFFIAFFVFYFFTSILSFANVLLITIILKYAGTSGLKNVLDDFAKVNWIWAIQAIVYTILVAISMGILVSFVATNINTILAIGLTLFLVQAFLFGCYLPISMVIKNDGMFKTSWFFPFYAPVRMFQFAWLEDIEYNFQLKGEIWTWVDGNNQLVVLEEYDDINSYQMNQYLNYQLYQVDGSEPGIEKKLLELKSVVEKNVTTKGWKLIKEVDPVHNANIFKDFKIVNGNSSFYRINSITYDKGNFHNSYWSLILLGLGWFVMINSGSLIVNKYMKK